MDGQEVVTRARRAIGHGCIYALGHGGLVGNSEWPWDDERRSDCSGFVMWAHWLSRHQGTAWINTDAMVQDGKTPGGLFDLIPWELALPGDLIVYGRGGGKSSYGHVGVVSTADDSGPLKAIHCSHGNWTRTTDAIQETGVGLWRIRPDTIIVRRAPSERVERGA